MTVTQTRWDLLSDVVERALDERQRMLARLVKSREDAGRKLQTLLDYRGAYRGQRQDQERAGITADRLRNHQSFTATLERAIEEQSDRLAQAQALVSACEVEVAELQRKLHSYGVLQEREATAERTRDRRVQQGHDDELAARMRAAG
ncbi:MAG: flagellar export protein FliJ [Burkholderiales bacterium]